MIAHFELNFAMKFSGIFLILIWPILAHSFVPLVMYHGMGDTAYGSINSIKTYLENELQDIYVTSIQMGNNAEEDFLSGYFMNLNLQVLDFCPLFL